MTFLLILILLVLVFGSGWLKGALRAVCMIGAGAVALGLLVRVFGVSPSAIIYTALAVILVGGGLATMLIPKHGKPKWAKDSHSG